MICHSDSSIVFIISSGYCAQSIYTFPWAISLDGTPFPSTDLSPPAQWDALPFYSKAQIILFVGFLEWYSEYSKQGVDHYTNGGKPGAYPTFDPIPHPAINLYDPLGLSRFMSESMKERRLRVELNNGRLAMIGIISLLCEQTIPGSVPVLNGVVESYGGNIMAPFDETDFPDLMNL